MAYLDVKIGDVAVLRKPHPCGSTHWTITRTGADIGLQCITCNRRIMLEREQFESQIKRLELSEVSADIVVSSENAS